MTDEPPEDPQRPEPQEAAAPGFHLLDLVALVVGYSLASLLARAFWPSAGAESPVVLIFLVLEYIWLGLAMSGPAVLLIRRSRRPDADAPEPHTWAELAWLIIGFYWNAMAILVVPLRMPGTKLLDAAVLGAFPIVAALVLRYLAPKYLQQPRAKPIWTHRVAVVLLLSWPFAWMILILLGKTL